MEAEMYISNSSESSINRIIESSEAHTNNPRVILRTLDNICREYKIHPLIIKIDVEGYEIKVINGFKEQSATTQMFLIENGQTSEIRNTMNGMGFNGPWFFHYNRKCFFHFLQARPEDPIYIREGFMQELEKDRIMFIT
jgi:hypothetical protein